MGLTVKERYAVIRELAPRYQQARKGERSRILDEFMHLTGLVRSYASHVLKHYGTSKSVLVNGQRVVVVVGERSSGTKKRKRPRRYDAAGAEVKDKLTVLYESLNPAHLMRCLTRLQQRLFEAALRTPKITAVPPGYPAEHHPWRQSHLPSRSTTAPTPLASQPKNPNNLSEVSA